MEETNKDERELRDREIAYSRNVKAGKRIYYLDVKRSRNGELYLSLTESKKKVAGTPEHPDVTYEKHKIFLYQEDMSKFTEALIDVIRYMQDHQLATAGETMPAEDLVSGLDPWMETNTDLDTGDDEPAIRLNLEDFE